MRFEKVKRCADADITLPKRATEYSAGYDFEAAEDVIIPSYRKIADPDIDVVDLETAKLHLNIKPTLVPTGIKCKLESNKFLQLNVRSSLPLKSLLLLANGSGIIDADYYNNESTDGEVMFQLINLAPFDIKIRKGDRIGQGVIMDYYTTEDDIPGGERTGGFGSTK